MADGANMGEVIDFIKKAIDEIGFENVTIISTKDQFHAMLNGTDLKVSFLEDEDEEIIIELSLGESCFFYPREDFCNFFDVVLRIADAQGLFKAPDDLELPEITYKED